MRRKKGGKMYDVNFLFNLTGKNRQSKILVLKAFRNRTEALGQFCSFVYNSGHLGLRNVY